MSETTYVNTISAVNGAAAATNPPPPPHPTVLHRVFSMQGGDEDNSYAKNSDAPATAISLSKPFLSQALHAMKLRDLPSLAVADLGCATGCNTVATVDHVTDALRRRYAAELGAEPEYEAFFSDLPSNDFNSLFRSLADGRRRPYFAAGVPGSFYRRLFPREKLHVIVSLSALHWLSQIPVTVQDRRSPAWNKGTVWINGGNKTAAEAYAKQSEEDLEEFLRCRKEEMVIGGLLFMLMGGRPESQPPENQLGDPETTAKHPFTTSMDQSWQDLLNEGLIKEEIRDGFNIPAYMRSKVEVERAITSCGGFELFKIDYLKIEEHSKEKQQEWTTDPVSYGRARANLVRATLGPFVSAHLGPLLSDKLFCRFEQRVSTDVSLLRKTCFYGVIVVSAFRV